MPDSVLPPDVRDQVAALEARVSALERRISWGGDDRVKNEITFSYAGGLESGTESPPIRSRYSHALISVNFMLGTAGTTGTVIDVKRNGSVVATLTIPANQNSYLGMVDADMGKDQDYITLRVVTAGTGASDLTAQCRFA